MQWVKLHVYQPKIALQRFNFRQRAIFVEG